MAALPTNPKPVDFRVLLVIVGAKLQEDRDSLIKLVSDPDRGIRDTASQDALMKEIQASMRLIDVMHGHLDIFGYRLGETPLVRTEDQQLYDEHHEPEAQVETRPVAPAKPLAAVDFTSLEQHMEEARRGHPIPVTAEGPSGQAPA